MEVGFYELDWVLRSRHRLPVEKRSAFESRLRHLQRLGLTPEVKTGKGTKASYSAREVIRFAIALELIELGVTPERAVEVVHSGHEALVAGIRDFVASGPSEIILLAVDLSLLEQSPSFELLSAKEVSRRLRSPRENGSFIRRIIINLTGLVDALQPPLSEVHQFLEESLIGSSTRDAPDLRKALAAWVNEGATSDGDDP